MRNFLVTAGLLLLIAGLVWPWIARLGLGRLPGDIVIEHGNTRFYLPLTSCLIVSLVITVVLWVFRR